jgi:hypothetical protein
LVTKNKIALTILGLGLLALVIAVSQRITLGSPSFELASEFIYSNKDLEGNIGKIKKISPNGTLEFFGSADEKPYIRYKVKVHGEKGDAYINVKIIDFDKKSNKYQEIFFEDIELYKK